ncbi:hypothetical protein [Planktotalea sp.]|uniref:hypothetical protein n=1 Tax=Planktotalea sp. TaxID=2029877 RepID=UPI003D6A3D42
MSEDETNSAKTVSQLVMSFISVLRRPFEIGMTGAALVGVLYLADRNEILPQTFKGGGVEVNFQAKVVQTAAESEQGLIALRANVEALESELSELKLALSNSNDQQIATALESSEPIKTTLKSDPDGASKDSLLVEKNQLIQTKGYMWLGTYDPSVEGWIDASVRTLDGNLLKPPTELSNELLEVSTTVNVRDEFPPDNKIYFRAVRALGVAETGTRVTLLAAPRVYSRGDVQQIWARVDIEISPYIGIASAD